MNRHVFIAIPTYERQAEITQCLRALSASHCNGLEIVICDHGERPVFPIKDLPENIFVTVVRGSSDLWWSGAINSAIRVVLPKLCEDDVVITLNDDTCPTQEWLAAILGAHDSYPNALIGSVGIDRSLDGVICYGVPRINWLTGKQNMQWVGKTATFLKDQPITQADRLPGRGTLIPAGVIRKIGLFDEKRFPHYVADDDFSLRAKAGGFQLLVEPKAILICDSRKSGLGAVGMPRLSWNAFVSSLTSIRSSNNLINRFHFAWRHCPRYLLISFLLLSTARLCLRQLWPRSS